MNIWTPLLLLSLFSSLALADDLGELPWAETGRRTPAQASRVTDARQLLVNVDPSEFDSFYDGDPLSPNNGTLAKILFRLPRFTQSDLERLARRHVDWQPLLDNPAENRVAVVRLEGRVQEVVQHSLPPEMVELFEFSHYFLVTLAVDDSPHPIVVHALRIPDAWKEHLEEPLEEPAVVHGLFLQIGVEDEQPILHFAADRVAWYPTRANPQWKVTPDDVLLARLGVDVGRMHEARQRNRRPLEAADYETFYQLLAAARTVATAETPAPPAQRFELVPLLSQPELHQGRRMSVTGRARRITKIMVESPDIRERFGITHYWQIDSLVPVGPTTIQFQTGDPDSPAPSYADSFPMTLCVLQLPAELEQARQRAEEIGPDDTLNEPIEFDGFFYKLWVYRSRYTSQFDRRLMQPSPFFVAYEVRRPERPGSNVWLGLGIGGGFLLVLAAIWIAIWWYGKRDDEVERRLFARRGPDKSLNDLNLDVKTGPDFSNLD